MKAHILSVGDELVLGQTVDTNSAWISQQLAGVGCDIAGHATVGDDQSAIEQAIRSVAGTVDLLIISGGIGPTQDDLTRQALAGVLGVDLEENSEWLTHLENHFTRLGRSMPPMNRVQALIPRGAEMLWNHAGTAAGIKVEMRGQGTGERGKQDKIHSLTDAPSPLNTLIFCVPGVPKEMKAMITRDVLPLVGGRSSGAVLLQTTLHTFGLGESAIAQRLGNVMARDRNPSVGTTVADGLVSLRVNARAPNAAQGQSELDATIAACHAAIGPLIFGRDGETLPQIVLRLLANNEKPLTVATAESCTGGWLAKMLTDEPGSSRYFRQGWVTYTNESKVVQLGVTPETLAAHGAVSEPTVAEMAAGARERSGADIAMSISGIAGPDGGTPDKPVGTVCFGLAHAGGVVTRTFGMFGDRNMVRDRSAKMALTLLRFHLLREEVPF